MKLREQQKKCCTRKTKTPIGDSRGGSGWARKEWGRLGRRTRRGYDDSQPCGVKEKRYVGCVKKKKSLISNSKSGEKAGKINEKSQEYLTKTQTWLRYGSRKVGSEKNKVPRGGEFQKDV